MKHFYPAIAVTTFFIVFTGLLFPAIIWVFAQVLFPHQANGSLLKRSDGTILGSEIIGQVFTQPHYFHPRPSAAGSGYDAANSSGTNLGPTSAKLISGIADDPVTKDVDESYAGVTQLADAYRKENMLAAEVLLPADAVTRSASGLDPDITPANARLQAKRVALARNMTEQEVLALVDKQITTRFFGIIGEPRVNVLKLNLAVDALKPSKAKS